MLVDDVIRRAFQGSPFLVDHVHLSRKATWSKPGKGEYLYLDVILSGDIPCGDDVQPWQLTDEYELDLIARRLVEDCKGARERCRQ